jgi:hypothetical protein
MRFSTGRSRSWKGYWDEAGDWARALIWAAKRKMKTAIFMLRALSGENTNNNPLPGDQGWKSPWEKKCGHYRLSYIFSKLLISISKSNAPTANCPLF